MKNLITPKSSVDSGACSPGQSDQAQQAPMSLEEQIQYAVEHLESIAGSANLMAATSQHVRGGIHPKAFTAYAERLLSEASNPADSAEKALILQVQFAQQAAGNLLMKAALSNLPKDVKAYNAEAARMMTEVRKTALALKEYREPSKRKAVQFVRQQNIAQNQQVAMVEPPPAEPAATVPASPTPPRAEPLRVGHETESAITIPRACQSERRELLPTARRTAPAKPAATAARLAERVLKVESIDPSDDEFVFPIGDE